MIGHLPIWSLSIGHHLPENNPITPCITGWCKFPVSNGFWRCPSDWNLSPLWAKQIIYHNLLALIRFQISYYIGSKLVGIQFQGGILSCQERGSHCTVRNPCTQRYSSLDPNFTFLWNMNFTMVIVPCTLNWKYVPLNLLELSKYVLYCPKVRPCYNTMIVLRIQRWKTGWLHYSVSSLQYNEDTKML